MKGIICINKPQFCTSFDVVARLRRILNIKKIGHSGTLDPIATGVLPVFVGKATRAISFLPNTDKTYVVGFKLGLETDTFDITGKVVKQFSSNVSFNELKGVLKSFEGELSQVPPKFSAIKINGVPAYKLARAGQAFEVKARRVVVFKVECLEFNEAEQLGRFEVCCSSGTYVRSICHDLGKKLGVGCVMTSLVRTKASGWTLNDCHSLEEVEKLCLCKGVQSALLKLESAFGNLAHVKLSLAEKTKFLNGAKIKLNSKIELTGLVLVFHQNEFLGLARIVGGVLYVEKLFV